MAKLMDIRKVSVPGCEFYESVEDTIAVTFIGRLKGITPEGRAALSKAAPFCRLLRTLVKAFQAGRKVDKAAACRVFGVPSRVFNTAKVTAEGIIQSATECLKVALADLEVAIGRLEEEKAAAPVGELFGRERRLRHLRRRQARLLAQAGRPRIHFGRRFYDRQEEAGWKRAYQQARSDRMGCLGSADETGGNSTFQIRSESVEGATRFGVWHRGQLLGHFKLKPKERAELETILAINHQPFAFSEEVCRFGKKQGQPVRRKVSAGRVPLTVWFKRHENEHWYVHVSFLKGRQAPDYAPVGAIGVDLNCDSIADSAVVMGDGQPVVLAHGKRYFDPGLRREAKAAWIYDQINQIVAEAKARRFAVVLEYLDFEHCKRWLRTKLGAMLHVMPYRKIRQAFERRCMEQGVVLRYVKSNYTSILGAILTDYPGLGRDQAAAVVIGLRSLQAGNAWLEAKSREFGEAQRCRLRINRKKRFGCSVTIDGILTDRQSEAMPPEDRRADVHWFQNRVAREISGLSKAMGGFLYREGWVPTCWKGPGTGPIGLQKSPWHPVVPESVLAPRQRTECSGLSK